MPVLQLYHTFAAKNMHSTVVWYYTVQYECYCFWIQATEVKLEQVNFNAEFISRMIPRLEWSAICDAAESVSCMHVYKLQELLLHCSFKTYVDSGLWVTVFVACSM